MVMVAKKTETVKASSKPKLKAEAARVNAQFELEYGEWIHEDMIGADVDPDGATPEQAFRTAAYFCVEFYIGDRVGNRINNWEVKLSDPEIFEIARWQMLRVV